MTQKFFISSLLVFSLVLSGCASNSNVKPPQEPLALLQLSQKNMQGMMALSNDANFKIHFTGKSKDAKSSSFDLNLHVNMQQDFVDPKSSSMLLEIDGSLDGVSSAVEKSPFPLSLAAQIFANNSAAYIKVSSLQSKEELLPPESQKQLIGQWWQVPLPPGAFEQFVADIRVQQSVSQISALSGQSLDFPDFFSDRKYLEKLDYEGVSSVKAGDSFRYTFSFGKVFFDALKIALSKGEKLSDTQIKDFEQVLSTATGSGEAFVSVDGNYLAKMVLNAAVPHFIDSEGSEGSVDFHFDVESYDFGKKPDFKVPSDAKVFDLAGFLGNFSAAMQQ
ncbi:MAG: hypothetical protein AAB551_03295 [Patescibacteria group bacterium]